MKWGTLLVLAVNSCTATALASGSPVMPQNVSKIAIVDLRLPLAGGLAGGVANAILHPIDTIKTMQQVRGRTGEGPAQSVLSSLRQSGGLRRLYGGFFPAVLGSIPSSALYFGGYETAKRILKERCSSVLSLPTIHMLAAATGNVVSSAVFVPKEAIKQQIQAYRTNSITLDGIGKAGEASNFAIISHIGRSKGLKGFYPNYRTTLLRNIPSAVIRFTLYEELRRRVKDHVDEKYESAAFLLVGALSSCLASTVTTPFDVVKTRLATGVLQLPREASSAMLVGSLISAIGNIAANEGLAGLFAGVQTRALWSALYGGIGFASFEQCKKLLGVAEELRPVGAACTSTKQKSVAFGAKARAWATERSKPTATSTTSTTTKYPVRPVSSVERPFLPVKMPPPLVSLTNSCGASSGVYS